MECPICTLMFKPVMSLEQHLKTHPVDKLIQVLAAHTTGKSVAPPVPTPRVATVSEIAEEQVPSSSGKVQPSRYCFHCGTSGHTVPYCVAFNNLSATERQESIKKTGRCYNCLAWDHKVHRCQSKNRCKECGGMHHTQLH